jgi:hypothetical protein
MTSEHPRFLLRAQYRPSPKYLQIAQFSGVRWHNIGTNRARFALDERSCQLKGAARRQIDEVLEGLERRAAHTLSSLTQL